MRRGKLEMTLSAAEAMSHLSEIEDAYLAQAAPA
jgi:hypothetical protein